jgi:2-oxoglutarate ferredoxin oxidoreductase subunit alpha
LKDHDLNNKSPAREFINGAEAISRAAVDSGCNFFSGYPITPATQILVHMATALPKVGGIAIQAEDEISAIGYCIGAAMSGARVMTATSGPGISLYSENIGLAIMGEVPLVIIDCQRMGPATGGATTVAQGDIQFIRWGTSGGYPIIALSPTSVEDCYSLTCRSFDLAERFRVPVFIITDKETVTTSVTVDRELVSGYRAKSKNIISEVDEFIPYHFDNIEDTPQLSPIGGAHIVRFTTSSHDERGYISTESSIVGRMNQHLSEKIAKNLEQITLVEEDLEAGADTLVISYGITSQSVKEAVREARKDGYKVSTLTILSLWPVPEQKIITAMRGKQRVVVAELNLGQYCREIERLARGEVEVVGIHRVDGDLITPKDILQRGIIQ